MSGFSQHLLKQTSPRGVSIPIPKGRLKVAQGEPDFLLGLVDRH